MHAIRAAFGAVVGISRTNERGAGELAGVQFFEWGRMLQDVFAEAEMLENRLPRLLQKDARTCRTEDGSLLDDGDIMAIASQKQRRSRPGNTTTDDPDTIFAGHRLHFRAQGSSHEGIINIRILTLGFGPFQSYLHGDEFELRGLQSLLEILVIIVDFLVLNPFQCQSRE